MRRKVYNQLLEWKREEQGKTAILIEGARRVGKSYVAEEFGRNEYRSYMLIDFSKASREIFDLFENYLHNLDEVFERLQLFYHVTLYERESLIIFDEVQFCPRARSSIKHLVADGRYDYIETGSLISIREHVKDILIPSEEQAIEMFPMDFEEFLWAKGEDTLMPFIRKCFEKCEPVGDLLHRRSMDLFRLYMMCGGMPQVVEAFVTTANLTAVDRVKRNILSLYRNDIRKYAGKEAFRVLAIFDEIPGQLQRHEKKFRLADISDNARMRDYGDSFFWLADAKMVNCCYNSTAPNIGLRLNEDRMTLKCYLGDTGLLVAMAFEEKTERVALYQKLISGKLEVNEGMLMENIVAQMLRASGHKLYFYSKSDNQNAENRMEIDFLTSKSKVTSRHNINPIEVKSGKRYALSSLEKCISKFGQYINVPYVLHDKDLKVDNGIVYLPLYMTPLL